MNIPRIIGSSWSDLSNEWYLFDKVRGVVKEINKGYAVRAEMECFVFVPTLGVWTPLYSPNAMVHVSSVIGADSATVNYQVSSAPYNAVIEALAHRSASVT